MYVHVMCVHKHMCAYMYVCLCLCVYMYMCVCIVWGVCVLKSVRMLALLKHLLIMRISYPRVMNCILPFVFWFFKTGFPCKARLSQNQLCRPGWSQAHRDLPASASQVLGLKPPLLSFYFFFNFEF